MKRVIILLSIVSLLMVVCPLAISEETAYPPTIIGLEEVDGKEVARIGKQIEVIWNYSVNNPRIRVTAGHRDNDGKYVEDSILINSSSKKGDTKIDLSKYSLYNSPILWVYVMYFQNNRTYSYVKEYDIIGPLVSGIYYEDISMYVKQINMIAGDELQLAFSVIPLNAHDKRLSYSTEDPAIAIMDETGKITALSPGTTSYKVSTMDGSNISRTGKIKVSCRDHIKEYDKAVEPTWTETGLTNEVKCAVCGELLSSQKMIPALKDMSVLLLPENLKEIGDEAFYRISCEAVIISDQCTSIGKEAFADSPELLYVKIPSSVTDIAEDAFAGCENVTVFKQSNQIQE